MCPDDPEPGVVYFNRSGLSLCLRSRLGGLTNDLGMQGGCGSKDGKYETVFVVDRLRGLPLFSSKATKVSSCQHTCIVREITRCEKKISPAACYPNSEVVGRERYQVVPRLSLFIEFGRIAIHRLL